MAKNTQSNKNIIQIHNLVKVAEPKKSRPRRRPQEAPQEMPSRMMGQFAPQIQPVFQQTYSQQPLAVAERTTRQQEINRSVIDGIQRGAAVDADIPNIVNNVISNEAARLNEAQDTKKQRQHSMLRDVLKRIPDENTNADIPLSRGQSPSADESKPLIVENQDIFADEDTRQAPYMQEEDETQSYMEPASENEQQIEPPGEELSRAISRAQSAISEVKKLEENNTKNELIDLLESEGVVKIRNRKPNSLPKNAIAEAIVDARRGKKTFEPRAG